MPLHLRLLLPAFTLALGHALGFIQPVGLLLGTAACVLILLGERRLPAWLWQALVLVTGIALAAHVLPGFIPWTLWQPRQISPDAPPYALRLSWDKLLLGTALLAWWLGQSRRPVISLKLAWLACLATLPLIPVLAMALGLVAWQPKWPQGVLLWLAVNLGAAVLAEELLFRGLLQPVLVKRLGSWPGLLLTAGLFGVAHLPFSTLFAMVAALAGLGYGLAFHYSGRISLAIALHAAVNLVHFLLLSYPLRLA
ncbi:CPBP family intramembrane metalloprotease [Ectopseudomonas mendocina]|uniref:CPBP family intramembrane metalloprotease n=1 Tax=Ectopseudomonas mendocina TaxID=300 RepID=A0ABD7RNH8_ECTME|nr:CPBP family intramembrane glutamic endopeptidase [Pseudomonas mendocina]TRO10016.1 CPBP family intramembrane metalloprotease [Pseudomonas mendocina]TRO12084.1 CPBP family intramembrane metalloprotease [Pseudomonas mendocina]